MLRDVRRSLLVPITRAIPVHSQPGQSSTITKGRNKDKQVRRKLDAHRTYTTIIRNCVSVLYLWNVLPRVFQALLVSSSRLLASSHSYSESCRKALRAFNSCSFRTPPHIHKRLLIVTYVADTDGV